MQKIYVYNTANRMHEFLGSSMVADDAVLADGQTLVVPADESNAYWDGTKWVGAMDLVTIYHYDDSGNWDGSDIAPTGTALKANETLERPADVNGLGMYIPKFDKTQNKWVETMPADEIKKLTETGKQEPNNDDKAFAALTAQLLQTQATIKTQGQQIASLTAQLLTNTKNTKN